MKIALIGDIHANLPALEAVIVHVKKQIIAEIWNVGDSTGYGAYPEEVIQFLQREEIISLAGNYDKKVVEFPSHDKKFRRKKRYEKYLAFKWAYENLTLDGLKYLQNLPEQLLLKRNNKNILLCHGSPVSNQELLTPETPDARLQYLADEARKSIPVGQQLDVIIFGHSHHPFSKILNGIWFINCGSVGRPDDGDPRASYALLDLSAGTINVTLHRVSYDVQRAVAAIRQHNLPESFAQMIIQGHDLDTTLPFKNI